MKRNKLKLVAASLFVVMLVLTTTLGVAVAATADADEQMTVEGEAISWNNNMAQKGYSTVYNHQDGINSVLGRIPSDTIWMFSGHGGEWGGTAATRLYFGDPADTSTYISGYNVPANTIKLAYADTCKSSVQHSWQPYDVSKGFINQGTKAYMGFNRDVYTYETGPFTDQFGYLLRIGATVHNAALWAGQQTPIGSDYTVYGDDSITI